MKNKIGKLGLILLGCFIGGSAFAAETITIGASPVPHAEILKQVATELSKDGITLDIKEINDYVTPNLLVEEKALDANFFQHRPYLAEFNKTHHTSLVELSPVEIEPMGLYAPLDNANLSLEKFIKTKQVKNLPKHLVLGVPNDTTNEGRALLLLQSHGIIKIKAHVAYPTLSDVTANPYNIMIKELDPAMLPRLLKAHQLDLAVINSNYALEASINPLADAIFIEDKNSPYVNIVVVRKDELNEPKMKKLKAVLHSKEIHDFILKQYHGAVIPAF